jgi:hypothetical protein
MSNRKNSTNYSPSTFARKKREGKLPWTKLFSESVHVLMSPHVSDRARSLWLLIQPILGEHDGYLLDLNGGPHTADSLARCLYGRGHVDTDLAKLIQYGALSDNNRIIFCPMMVKDTGRVLKGTSGNIVGVAKCNDDLVTVSRGNEVFNSERVEESRVDEKDIYSNSPTVTKTNYPNNRTASAFTGGAVLLSGLTEEDLEGVQAEFPAFDFPAVYQKFVAYHTNKRTQQATKEMLAGWFKREKPQDGPQNGPQKPQEKPKQSSKVKTSPGSQSASTVTQERQEAESYVPVEGRLAAANLDDLDLERSNYFEKIDWRIGNLHADMDKIRLLFWMTKRTPKEAAAYFVEVMGKGVSCGEKYLIFDEDQDGNFEGVLSHRERKRRDPKLNWGREFKLKELQEKGVDDSVWIDEINNQHTELFRHVQKNWPELEIGPELAGWIHATFDLPVIRVDPEIYAGSIKLKNNDQAWRIMYKIAEDPGQETERQEAEESSLETENASG